MQCSGFPLTGFGAPFGHDIELPQNKHCLLIYQSDFICRWWEKEINYMSSFI